MIYFGLIVAAFCANISVVAQTTALSVLGGSLALRGPDGSMMVATDCLYTERKSVFQTFGIGLAATMLSVLVCVWLLLNWEAALFCWIVTLYTCRKIYVNFQRVSLAFAYDEDDTVDFRDIMEGPGAVFAMPNRRYAKAPASGPASYKDNDDDSGGRLPMSHPSQRRRIPRENNAPAPDPYSLETV
jgi:hypothetical protein